MKRICEMSALELGAAIKEKSISVAEAVNAYLDNIEKMNPALNCYITVCAEKALERAKQVQEGIDSGALNGRLAGVPIAVKDNICTKGIRTTCASKMLEDFVPSYDATVIERINAAGMIILGKLNMDEFAMGSTGETSCFGAARNPWNTAHTAGGSSGGAAAAVSAGLAPIALGSDTGGSVRQPASYCSLTGLKPTYGAVSRSGLVAYASSLDQIGIIGRDAADCAALFELISGYDRRDMTSDAVYRFDAAELSDFSLKGRSIGIAREYLGDGLNPEIKKAVLAAADTFCKLGAKVGFFSQPETKYFVPAYYVTACAETSSNLARFDGVRYGHRSKSSADLDSLYTLSRTEGFGNEAKLRILLGSFVLSSGYYDEYYKRAMRAKRIISESFEKAFESFDFILSPVAPDTAPKLGINDDSPLKMYVSDIYTVSANLAGIPAVALPCGFDTNGMPVGFQLAGRRFSEAALLSAAGEYQKATDYHKKSPFEKEASL